MFLKKVLMIGALACVIMGGLGVLPSINAQDDSTQFPITLVDATGNEVTIESIDAIASGSGDVTEIIDALGFRDNLVGIDISSTYPPELLDEIQNIGFARRLTVEPIAAVNPTVFFCTEICSPTAVLDQLRDLDIPVVIIPDNETSGIELPVQKIEMVAAALGVPERGTALAQQVATEIDWVNTALANVVEPDPYVLMVYVRGVRLQLISGKDVPAEAMITTAGGIDAGADIGIEGYTTLNAELILTAFPDHILLMQDGVDSAGGLDTVRAIQGVSQVPAGENDSFIVVDDMFLLGMSTRTGQSLLTLAKTFHPSMTWELAVAYPYNITDATGTELTVDSAMPLLVTNAELFDLAQQLGYHPVRLESQSTDAGNLILATVDDDWQTWRDGGATVIVIPSQVEISMVATALGVPGRGEALAARRSKD